MLYLICLRPRPLKSDKDSWRYTNLKNIISFSRETGFGDFGVINLYRSQMSAYVHPCEHIVKMKGIVCAKQKQRPQRTIWLQNTC